MEENHQIGQKWHIAKAECLAADSDTKAEMHASLHHLTTPLPSWCTPSRTQQQSYMDLFPQLKSFMYLGLHLH